MNEKDLKLYSIPDQTPALNQNGEQVNLTSGDVQKIVESSLQNMNVPVQVQQNYLQSSNFVSGSAGWKLDALGNLEANNGNFRGDITGATGTFSGTVTATAFNIPDATTANSFHVDSSGNTWWGANVATGYTGANAYILNSGAAKFSNVTLPDLTTVTVNAPIVRSFTAGENLTAGDCLALSNGASYIESSNTVGSSGNVITTTAWTSQLFTTSANAISIEKVLIKFINSTSTATEALRVSLRADSGGSPTGADLGSGAVNVSTSISNTVETEVTFTFATPISVSPSTSYHIVVRESVETGDIATQVIRDTTGSTGTKTSINSGSSWSASNGPIKYKVYEFDTVAGYVYKSDADSPDTARNDFIGFCRVTTTSGTSCPVSIAGIATSLSGLSIGSKYYVSNTAGAVSTSAGSTTIKVGKAISTTEILITNIW